MTAAPYSFWMYIGTSVWAASRASAESTKPAGCVVVVRATVVDVEPPPIVVRDVAGVGAAAGATVVGLAGRHGRGASRLVSGARGDPDRERAEPGEQARCRHQGHEQASGAAIHRPEGIRRAGARGRTGPP